MTDWLADSAFDEREEKRPLLFMDDLASAISVGDSIYVTMDVLDAEALRDTEEKLCTTCSRDGAWRPGYGDVLFGAPEVIVVGHKNGTGRRQSRLTFDSLYARDVTKVLRLVEPCVGTTASDHLAAGHAVTAFVDVTPIVKHELTEGGNADRFLALFGHDVRYWTRSKRWLVWNDRYWVEDTTERVRTLAQQTVEILQAEILAAPQDEQAAYRQHIRRTNTAAGFRNLLEIARPRVAVRVEQLDRDPWLLGCANGTLDLRTGELRPELREDLITKQVAVDYDPCAYSELLDQFLRDAQPDPEVRQFLARAMGYSLTGDVSEDAFLIHWGEGENGKSSFLEMMVELMADYGRVTPTSTLLGKSASGIPNDVAALRGARFVSATEPEGRERLNEALVKRLTGGDTFSARFMRGEFFEFAPQCTVHLATNHKPVIVGRDKGIWRRVYLVPWTQTFEKVDKTIRSRLKEPEHLCALLAWAVQGCLEWQKDRADHGLAPPRAVLNATAEYREEQDTMARFLEECCMVDPENEKLCVRAGRFEKAYRTWCRENLVQPLANKDRRSELEQRGFWRTKPKGSFVWHGLDLVEGESPDLWSTPDSSQAHRN